MIFDDGESRVSREKFCQLLFTRLYMKTRSIMHNYTTESLFLENCHYKYIHNQQIHPTLEEIETNHFDVIEIQL